MKLKIRESKKNEVEDIKRLLNEYPVVGIVNLENLPAFQLLRIKFNLGEKARLKITKKRLIKIAFDELKGKKGLTDLKAELKGIPALIFTKEDPFMLAKLLNKSKSKCAAKPGQTAPNDIVIPAGSTDFPAGPMIGEFGQMGIKTKVEDGKITILNDKVIVKEGEVIDAKVAELLSKMKIEPMEIGLNLILTYKDGEVLTKDVLFVDEELYLNNIKLAYNDSIALAIEVGYACAEVVEKMISKAELEAKAVESKVNFSKTEEPKPVEQPKPEKQEPKIEEKKVEEVKVEEPQKEIPIEEKTVEEPQKEIPIEEKTVEEPQKEEEKVEEKIKEVKKEELDKIAEEMNPADFNEDAAKKAQDLLQQVVDAKIAKQDKLKGRVPKAEELAKKKKYVDEKEKDVSKLINTLKDKKARGEI